MNKQRMMDLATLIEQLPERNVDMKNIINDIGADVVEKLDSGVDDVRTCHTVGCIVGWAAVQAAQAKFEQDLDNFFTRAQKWLELAEMEAHDLFQPSYSWGWSATPKEVAAVMRRAVSDGSVTNEVWRPIDPAPATTTTTSSLDQSQ